MSTELERNYDDEVYDEEFYERCMGEEELIDEEEAISDVEDDKADDYDEYENPVRGIEVSFACEDCDYRWEDVVVKDDTDLEVEEYDTVCPMCGSTNITQI